MGGFLSRNHRERTDKNSNFANLDHPTSQHRRQNNTESNKHPPPRPPKRKKRTILPDVSTLKHIDDHVLKTPRSAERSIDTLGEYLTRHAVTELEKVRAFYKWVTENIRYDTDEYFGRKPRNTNHDASSLLLSKSSVCDGYASIFQLLCEYAGIPVKKITGFSKGYSFKPGSCFTKDTPTNHAWNAVYINEEWRFIETTWGAGSLGSNNQFTKDYTDFYFLTDPDQFIVDHYPYFDKDEQESSKWQLLKKPITLDTFNKRNKPSRHAREWNVRFSSHPNSVIEFEGSVDIKFCTKSTRLVDANLKLFDSSGRNKDQFVVAKKQGRNYTITVCPHLSGEYKLEVYGAISADAENLDCLMTYILKCKSVLKDLYPFPKFGSCFGPVENCKERGFQKIKKIPVSITTKTGELTIPLKVKDDIKVMATIKNSDDIKLNDYTLLEKVKSQSLRLKARFPKKGYYRLILYSQFNEQNYTPAFSILVHNLKEPTIPCSFPKTYPETIQFQCSLIEPLGNELPRNTAVRFKFASPLMTEASVLREVVPMKSSNAWDTIIKTPPHGEVRISGKREDNSTSWVVYSFKVV